MPGQPELGKAGPSLRPTSAIRPIARSPPAFPASCRDPSTGGSRALARHAAGLEREPDHGQRPAPAVTDPAVRSCEQLAERCVSPIGKETRTAWRGGTSARRRGSTVIAAAVVLAALAVTGWAPAGAAAPQSPAGSCVPGKLVDFCRAAPPADGFRLDKGVRDDRLPRRLADRSLPQQRPRPGGRHPGQPGSAAGADGPDPRRPRLGAWAVRAAAGVDVERPNQLVDIGPYATGSSGKYAGGCVVAK